MRGLRLTLAAPIRQVTPVNSAVSGPTTASRTLDLTPSAPMTRRAVRFVPSAKRTLHVPSGRFSTSSVRLAKVILMPAASVASHKTFWNFHRRMPMLWSSASSVSSASWAQATSVPSCLCHRRYMYSYPASRTALSSSGSMSRRTRRPLAYRPIAPPASFLKARADSYTSMSSPFRPQCFFSARAITSPPMPAPAINTGVGSFRSMLITLSTDAGLARPEAVMGGIGVGSWEGYSAREF